MRPPCFPPALRSTRARMDAAAIIESNYRQFVLPKANARKLTRLCVAEPVLPQGPAPSVPCSARRQLTLLMVPSVHTQPPHPLGAALLRLRAHSCLRWRFGCLVRLGQVLWPKVLGLADGGPPDPVLIGTVGAPGLPDHPVSFAAAEPAGRGGVRQAGGQAGTLMNYRYSGPAAGSSINQENPSEHRQAIDGQAGKQPEASQMMGETCD